MTLELLFRRFDVVCWALFHRKSFRRPIFRPSSRAGRTICLELIRWVETSWQVGTKYLRVPAGAPGRPHPLGGCFLLISIASQGTAPGGVAHSDLRWARGALSGGSKVVNSLYLLTYPAEIQRDDGDPSINQRLLCWSTFVSDESLANQEIDEHGQQILNHCRKWTRGEGRILPQRF
jgi:hypothetical protein